MSAVPDRFEIVLPDWLRERVAEPISIADQDERMRFVVGLSAANVVHGTGGPFAAAVFESDGGRLVSVGVNEVASAGNSIAHAEIIAIALAEAAGGGYDLGASGEPAHELVSSTEPCTMCLGAVVWSGVWRVVCAARDEDARHIGFDEGPKPADWVAALEARGIAVVRDVLRAEAVEVLEAYASGGGPIYNARQQGE